MNIKMVLSLVVATGIALVSACGGGGGGTTTAGIGGTGITASGAITGFGSVFVNGIEFETDTTRFSVDDDSGVDETDLRVGMIVTVTGTVNDDGISGAADTIDYDSDLEGPISGPITDNGTTKTFAVLGVTVEVSDTTTHFGDNLSFAGINSGDVVEVSGYINENGVLIASYIENQGGTYQPGDEVEAKGVVSNLDTSAGTFDLTSPAGSIPVNYSNSTALNGLPGGVLSEGQFVEVKGTLQAGGATPIDATEIEAEGFSEEEDNVSLEGIITNFVSVSNFLVAGRPVNAATADLSPDSLTLGNGLAVKVEGPVVSGVLIAKQVERDD